MDALPDPQKSQAVLIGVAQYEDESLHDLPGILGNVRSLAAALTGPSLWQLPAANVHVPTELTWPYAMKAAVQEAARAATDTLFVYYAGHGLLDRQNKLHLAIGNSVGDEPVATAVPYGWISEAAARSPAQRKIIVLDCCYAGSALYQSGSGTLGLDNVQIPSTGMYLFLASAANERALALSDDSTVFTGEFLSMLTNGIPGGPETISLKDVFDAMVPVLRARGYPEPHLYGDARADTVTFGANPAWSAQAPPLTAVDPASSDAMTAAAIQHALWAEQRAAIAERPGFRPVLPSDVNHDEPELKIQVVGSRELEGTFDIEVSRVGGGSVTVTLTRDALQASRHEARRDQEEEVELGHQTPEQSSMLQAEPRRARTPLLDVLAWALHLHLIQDDGAATWSPHRIGNGYAPDEKVLHEPGVQTGRHKILQIETENDVADLLESGNHVLLLGAGATGKTTIARNQAARAGTDGTGLIWLDLTDPQDGAESVLLTLLGQPRYERYLLVIDNLQAQPGTAGRHPVLELIPRLVDALGLRVTVLATAWDTVVSTVNPELYGLETISTNSSEVIRQLVSPLPPDHQEAVSVLAERDIEVAQVAVDFYRRHRKVPDRWEVAAQLAQTCGADKVSDPRERDVLYRFACLGALEIDIPKRLVARWPDAAERAAFFALWRRKLIESSDEAWSVGNSTRARLLMQYAHRAWGERRKPGAVVYDHLRVMGQRHVRSALAQLRLKYGDGQRGELGDLWAQCLDLTYQLEAHSRNDPTWRGNIAAAAFASIALGAMKSEYAPIVFAEVKPALERFGSVGIGSAAAAGAAGAARPAASTSFDSTLAIRGTSLPAIAAGRADPAQEIARRLQLGILISAEAGYSIERAAPRVRRLKQLVQDGVKPSGALAPSEAPWITAMIVSGLCRLNRGNVDATLREAARWLARAKADGGPYHGSWSTGTRCAEWLSIDDLTHQEVFATAFCVRALFDAARDTTRAVRTGGLDMLRTALPGLVGEGSEVVRAAAVAALLHCEDDWRRHIDVLRDLLRWAIIASQDEPGEGETAANGVLWAASMLLTVIPSTVTQELEDIVQQVLGSGGWGDADDAQRSAEDAPHDGGCAGTGTAVDRPREGHPTSAPANADRASTATEGSADASGSAMATDSTEPVATIVEHSAERLDEVRDTVSAIQQEIKDQIAKRRSLLRDISDRRSAATINGVLAQWLEYKAELDRATRGLDATSVDAALPAINGIGRVVFPNSWQDIA